MVYKGIVMEITRNYCVILTNNQEFIKLNIKKDIYESQEIYFTESDIYSQKSYAKWTFAAAIVLIGLFLSGIQIHQLYPNIYSHNAAIVSIDINPSIEFYINEDRNITKVKPLNEDAFSLVSDNWEGHSFRMVLNDYLDSAIKKGYLKQESTVLMSCASLNDDFDKEIIKKEVNRAIQEKNVSDITYGYIESNQKNVKKAQKANISIGKYEIYNDIKDTNQDMDTIEKVKNVKVSELILETKKVKLIKKKDKDKGNDKNETPKERLEDSLFYKDNIEKNINNNNNNKKSEKPNKKQNKEIIKNNSNEEEKNLKKTQQQKLNANDDDKDDEMDTEDDEVDTEIKESTKKKEKTTGNENYKNGKDVKIDTEEKSNNKKEKGNSNSSSKSNNKKKEK